MSVPEIGKLYKVRSRLFQIIDISEFNADIPENNHLLLTLEDIETARKQQVIHRTKNPVELDAELIDGTELLDTMGDGVDRTEDFDAFITALKWSTDSIFNKDMVRAPFYSNVKLNHFQLEPLVRALNMTRTSLLIADDVGLGKTIEAGLIVQEFLLRKKIQRILIVCPASLKVQWKREMKEKFAIDFEIMDTKRMAQIRREYGVNVNPWITHPRLITSLDFIKREENLSRFKAAASQTDETQTQTHHMNAIRWDFMILDEAHNAMPQPTAEYYKDSERSKAVRQLSRLFKHKVFLTATPHNGKTESFIAMMDMLDPEHFNRGQKRLDSVSQKRLETIMIRRMKSDIGNSIYTDGVFPAREVQALEIDDTPEERELYTLFNTYMRQIIQQTKEDNQNLQHVEFTFEILKKRLLSSYYAFNISINRFFNKIDVDNRDNNRLISYTMKKLGEDYDNDIQKQEDEAQLIDFTSATLNREEKQGVSAQLLELSDKLAAQNNAKLMAIQGFIDQRLKTDGDWNGEKLIIFTEYKDTLDHLQEKLSKKYAQKRILTLYGGMNDKERERVKTEFEQSPDISEGRILIATDAASEGINLQTHCRYMIHNEIPWNPIRLEQRNGRIHRIGQNRDVLITHFVQKNNEDSHILQTMVNKVNTIRYDINTSQQVLAEDIRNRIMQTSKKLTKADTVIRVAYAKKSREMKKKVDAAIKQTREKFGISEENKKQILERAIMMKTGAKAQDIFRHPTNKPAGIFTLERLPAEWKDLKDEVEYSHDSQPVKRQLTFEDPFFDSPYIHIHLNHPLMQRSMVFYRSLIWKMNDQIRRKTVRVARDLDDILFKIYMKSTVTDDYLNRISEDILTLDLYLLDDEIERCITPVNYTQTDDYDREKRDKLTQKLLKKFHENGPKISQWIAERNDEYLQQIREKWESEKANTIRELEQIKQEQEKEISNDISNLIRSIRKLTHIEDQRKLFQTDATVTDDVSQMKADIEYLSHKRKELLAIRTAEIQKLKTTTIRSDKVLFPFALEMIIPRNLVR